MRLPGQVQLLAALRSHQKEDRPTGSRAHRSGSSKRNGLRRGARHSLQAYHCRFRAVHDYNPSETVDRQQSTLAWDSPESLALMSTGTKGPDWAASSLFPCTASPAPSSVKKSTEDIVLHSELTKFCASGQQPVPVSLGAARPWEIGFERGLERGPTRETFFFSFFFPNFFGEIGMGSKREGLVLCS